MEAPLKVYAPPVLFATVVFSVGLFAGLTIAGQLALQASAPLSTPEWLAPVETIRMVSVGGVVVGLLGLLGIDFATGG